MTSWEEVADFTASGPLDCHYLIDGGSGTIRFGHAAVRAEQGQGDSVRLTFADGVSAPGKHVQLRAERDVLVLISNCPQINNPCNGWDPTPVRLLGWWS